ncbi:hypothetical protein ABZP36_009088 [Zizania latifolia]
MIDLLQLDALKTPNSKERPDGFVASRALYSKDVEFSPIPENLGTVTDEDLWMQLNKGCITGLEMRQMTPGFKCVPSLPRDKTSVATPEEPIDARCQRLENCSSDKQQLEESKVRCAALENERDLAQGRKLVLTRRACQVQAGGGPSCCREGRDTQGAGHGEDQDGGTKAGGVLPVHQIKGHCGELQDVPGVFALTFITA